MSPISVNNYKYIGDLDSKYDFIFLNFLSPQIPRLGERTFFQSKIILKDSVGVNNEKI